MIVSFVNFLFFVPFFYDLKMRFQRFYLSGVVLSVSCSAHVQLYNICAIVVYPAQGGASDSTSASTPIWLKNAAKKDNMFTLEQLEMYDGVRHPKIHTAINGIVWDMTDKVSRAIMFFWGDISV